MTEPSPPTIVAAAVRRGKWVYTGASRHVDIRALMVADRVKLSGTIDGFLTDDGAFADRRQATLIVLRAGQTHLHTGRIPSLKPGNELYSEDLW